MRPLRPVPSVVAVALACAAGAVGAQTTVDEEDALVREGVALRREGRDDDAAAVLRRAWGLRRSPRAAGQLALAEQALGRWSRAEALLLDSLASPDDPWVARNRAVLDGALAVARRHLGTLEVRGCPGDALTVDGERAAPSAEGIRLAAGTARVVCTHPGGEAIVRVVEVAADSVVRVTFPAAAVRAGAVPAEPRRVHTLAWVGVAVSGAAAVTLGALFAAGEAEARAYDSACIEAPSPDRAGCATRRVASQSLLDDYSAAMTVGWAALGVGVAVAGVGVGLSLASPRGRAPRATLQVSSRGVGLRVTF